MADARALAGLRRLVDHSRTQLEATPPRLGSGSFMSGEVEAFSKQLAAHQLAVQVLQLVADCLPDDTYIPIDLYRDGDVVDAEIHDEDYVSAEDRIASALLYHTKANSKPSGSGRDHCRECSEGRDLVGWPCPTAAMLGVEA